MKNSKKKLDEIRVELMTFPMLRERATNYATRPFSSLKFLGNIKSLNLDCFFYFKIDF